MWFLITIRFRQLYRMLRATGWGILAVLVLVTAGLWIPALVRLETLTPTLALGAGLVLAAFIHFNRSDGSLTRQMALPVGQTGLVDTALALSPGVVLLLLMGNWPAALAFTGGLAVAALPMGGLAGAWRKKAKFSIPVLPADLFEWRSGIRRYPLGWLLSGLLQWGAGLHMGFFLAALGIGLVLLGTLFESLEPKELLPEGQYALLRKWRRYALALHIFFLPAYTLGLLGQAMPFWLVLYGLAALETLLALLFFYKYSVWRPGLEQATGSAFTTIGLLLVLIPGGILAAVPLAGWVAYKGIRQMNQWWGKANSF